MTKDLFIVPRKEKYTHILLKQNSQHFDLTQLPLIRDITILSEFFNFLMTIGWSTTVTIQVYMLFQSIQTSIKHNLFFLRLMSVQYIGFIFTLKRTPSLPLIRNAKFANSIKMVTTQPSKKYLQLIFTGTTFQDNQPKAPAK